MQRPDFSLRRTFGFIGVGTIVTMIIHWSYYGVIDLSEYITQLAVGLSLVAVGIAYWSFKPDIEKLVELFHTEPKANHSRKLSLAFEIMSKGHFDVKDEKNIFCVPYPYEEYQKYIQRLERPTNSQIMESFESGNYDFKEDFEYIEFNKSPEASFTQAYEHIKSYKRIQEELDNVEKTHQSFMDFWKKNEDNARVMGLRMINREKQPEPFYSEYMALAKIATDALQSFQKSCEILAEKLDDGTYIKGTCEFCR